MEFTGPGIQELSIVDRLSMANMAIEAGAKNGIFIADDQTRRYLKEHYRGDYTEYEPDQDAEYEQTIEIDLCEIEPVVALPHLPENTRFVSQIGDIPIDQAVIGSCTNCLLYTSRCV